MKKETLLTVLLTCSASSVFAQFEGSRAFTFKENNNHVVQLQKSGGSAGKHGNVKIEFYAHMAFKITSPDGLTVLIDPWRNDPTGTFGVWYPAKFPEIPVDVVLSTHAHFDHDAVYQPHATMVLDRLAGEFKLSDVKIMGIADKHQSQAPGEVKWDQILRDKFHVTNLAPPDNGTSWDNIIYVVETGGLRIGFWGDNRPNPAPGVLEGLKNLDVLIMNIDGSEHILSYAQINGLLDQLKPKAVIPGHYLSKGAVLPSSSLKPATAWVDTQKDKVNLPSAELLLTDKILEKADRRVYYFGDHFKQN